MTSELEIPIGTKEQPKLTAGSVIVKDITIEPPKEGSKAKLIMLHCLHPDREELVKFSNVKLKKVQGNNETIKKDALWWNLDDEGSIRKGSVVAQLLNFYNKKTLAELKGSSVITEADSNNWLCIKAY
jgi:hypothetical protein